MDSLSPHQLIYELAPENIPLVLRQIAQPPAQLFVRGDAGALQRHCIAIVGTRHPSLLGIRTAREIAGGLARAGVCVVSGLAYGIDAQVHEAVLDAGGTTVGVLASSLEDNAIYPQAHARLASRIATHGGCLISEYPANPHPFKYQFPLRNRIISGISRAVVVIEAQEKSGALITAYAALDQNRDVFAVPGSIYSPTSRGTNQLIKRGAKLVTSASDVIEEYPDLQPGRTQQRLAFAPRTTQEALVLHSLTSQPKYIDFIVRQTNLRPQDALATLATLESAGIVAQEQGSYYLIHSLSPP